MNSFGLLPGILQQCSCLYKKEKTIWGKVKMLYIPYLKYPHLICGTPQYICGTPHEHTEYMRILCGTPHCNGEPCNEFRTCGIFSTSVTGKISASMWKVCGEFRISFFTMRKNAEIIKQILQRKMS